MVGDEFEEFLREVRLCSDFSEMSDDARARIVEAFIKWKIARIQMERDKLAEKLKSYEK